MSRAYKFRDQDRLYFVTFATVSWIDALTRPQYKDIIVDSINFCVKNKGLEVYAWCIMSNHVHMIIGTTGEKMEHILRDLKKFTSRNITQAIIENQQESRRAWLLYMFEWHGQQNPHNKQYQFWQQDNKPIELSDNKMMDQRLHYIHMNPVKDGIVAEPEHYLYSSALDYAEGKGMIPVVFIEYLPFNNYQLSYTSKPLSRDSVW
ncbi:MAG: transposase [Cyclobacteriaceae bacterium]